MPQTKKRTTAKPAPLVKIRRPRPGSKAEAILTLTATTPATPPEIADRVNTSRQMVHDVLKRYGILPNSLESFKEHRADLFAGTAERVLRNLDDERLKAASANNLAYTLMQLSTMERLERGQSTANVASIHADIAALKEAQAGS